MFVISRSFIKNKIDWSGNRRLQREQRELKAPQERSDEEIEVVPAESVRLERKSILFGFKDNYIIMKSTHLISNSNDYYSVRNFVFFSILPKTKSATNAMIVAKIAPV